MSVRLSQTEVRVRKILVEVANGKLETRWARTVTYKELWERISRTKWGQGRVPEIVRMVLNISEYELRHGRPPLNELVVRRDRGISGDEWSGTKRSLERRGVVVPYLSHEDAQWACWTYWGQDAASKVTPYEAEEGYQQDRTVRFRNRNAKLILERKRLDDFRCQACGFRLEVNGDCIIDCHHKYPLSGGAGARVTKIDALICLCPTCHRIAHTRKPNPLDADEIRELRKTLGKARAASAH
jgi:hypothetical protein